MAKDITLDDQIKEQHREVSMREALYPEWTKGPSPKLKPQTAEHRLACAKATLKLLRELKAQSSGEQTSLF